MPKLPQRVWPLQGATNFRDLGGYPGRSGRPLRWRRLFRSDRLGCLTEADKSLLAGLGPATALDFRGRAERAALRPLPPMLIGASVMLSLAMGLRQRLGILMPPLTRSTGIAVGDFTLAIAVQNLVWGVLQPVAGTRAARPGMRRLMLGGALLYALIYALL